MRQRIDDLFRRPAATWKAWVFITTQLDLVFLANGVTALLCFEPFRYEAPLVGAANQQRILGQQVVLLSTRVAG